MLVPGHRPAILCLLLLLAAAAAGGGPITLEPRPHDPRLVYVKPLDSGGLLGAAQGAAIAVDPEGFAYVTGALDGDAFVARLTPAGDSIEFLTRLGGTDDDDGTAIALGPRGEIYVAGVTSSDDFPGSRPARTRRGGRTDAFVVRLNSDGTRLLDTAILGGSGDEAAAGIALDSSGDVVVTGTTSSYDFPITRRAFQPSLAGMDDAFVARLSSGGLRRVYSTYLGGSGIDRGAAVAIDAKGNAYVSGSTSSADFPATDSAQPLYGGAGSKGTGDGFVSKLDAAGSRLAWSTFLGGRGDDEAVALLVDAQGEVLVAGTTSSDDFAVAGPSNRALAGGSDAFVVRLDAAGQRILTSSLLGSSGDERLTGLAWSAKGGLYAAGVTSSADWPPAVPGAGFAHGLASFVLDLSAGGTAIRDAALLEEAGTGGGIAMARGVSAGPGGDIYVTGTTRETGLTAASSEEHAAGFVTKVAFGTLAAGCPGSINFTNAAGTGLWADPNNWDLARVPAAADDVCIDSGLDVTISTGLWTVNSLTSQGALTLGSGTSLSLTTASRLKDLMNQGGTLSGAGTIDVDGTLTLRGGTIGGPSTNTSVLNVNGTMVLDTNVFNPVSHRILNLKGTVLHTAGSLSNQTGTTINNKGTYSAVLGSVNYTGSVSFINTGIVEKTGAGNFNMAAPFTNSGTVDIKEGKLTFGVAFSQGAGTTRLSGGILASNSPVVIRGGTLAGSGSILCNVLLAGGTLSPGLSPGTVNITGEYNQSAASSLNIELDGLAPGLQHDQIVMNGTAIVTLGGTLNIALAGGFTPALGDRFDIILFNSRTGTFATLNQPPPAGGVAFNVSYGANTVTLVTVSASMQSANLSLDVQDSPDPVVKDSTLTYTLSVSNSGPDNATDVKVTDPLPATTTFLSASGSGWSCGNGTGPVICTLPGLAAGASSTVTIQVKPTSAPTALLNVATVTANESDPLPGNNTAQQATQVSLSGADLSVTMVDAPDPIRIDAPLTYSIVVSNAGLDSASSISLIDTLPAGASYLSFSGLGWACTPSAGHVTCISNSIAPGNSLPLDLIVASPSAGGEAVNNVSVTSGSNDPDPNNSTTSATTTVLPAQADLAIDSSDTPDPVGAFGQVIYSVSLTNNGPDPAHNIVLVNTLPAGAVFVNATGAGWICQNAAGTVTCTRNLLGVGDTRPLELTATAPATPGEFDDTATASSAATDPDTSNNTTSEHTTVVLTHADLSIIGTDSPDPVFAGEQLAYTLQVGNAGPDPAVFLTVTDTLPQGSAIVSASGSGWTCAHAAGVVTCTLPSLQIGPTAPIQIVVSAPVTGGTLSNIASVASATDDPAPLNDSSVEQTVVFVPHADLSVSMTDAPDPVTETSAVIYSITVANLGPDPVKSVRVVDTLPGNLFFVDVTAPGWACSRTLTTVTCIAAEMPVGGLPAINIRSPVPPGAGTLTNSATVSAVVIDGDPSNNQATEQTATVPLGADMAARMSTDPDPVESGEEFSYSIGAFNGGPLPASGVQLMAVLPPGVEFVDSATTPADMKTDPDGTVRLTYSLSDIPPNAMVSVNVTARCLGPDPALKSTATVNATQFDPALANNTTVLFTNCIGLSGSARFSQRSITPASTSLSMPAAITVPGATIDPSTVSITHVNDERITPITGAPASGKVNFNRQTLLRTIQEQLRSCTPLEGVPVKVKVSGRTTTGDFFTATDTIAYINISPCPDGSTACVSVKPTSLKLTSYSTSPIQVTLGLCMGPIVQGTVKLAKIDGVSAFAFTTPSPKKPNRVMLNRADLVNALFPVIGFCPAKQLKPLTLTFRGLTQFLDPFEVTAPFVVDCASGV